MKATRRYAAGLAAIVTATAGLLAGTGLMAGSASAGGFPAFVGPLHKVTTLGPRLHRQPGQAPQR
jgi:hypothetical protein